MLVYFDHLFSIYTRESIIEYLENYIIGDLTGKSGDLLLRVTNIAYQNGFAEVDTSVCFPEMTEPEVRRCIRTWNLARIVRKQGTGKVIVNGEILLREPRNRLEYNDDAGHLNDILSAYRDFTGTEIAFMTQWRDDSGTSKEAFLTNIRKMLDANPGMGITAILENACGNKSQEELNQSVKEYSLAYEIMEIFGQDQTEPSASDIQYIRNWKNSWGYSDKEILDIAKEDYESPTFDYLNGMLKNIYETKKATGVSSVSEACMLTEKLRKLNKVLGSKETNTDALIMFKRMTETYSEGMLELAAEECAEANKHRLIFVLRLLMKWETNDIRTETDVLNDRKKKQYAKELLSKVYAVWYGDTMPNPAIKAEDVRYAERWMKLNVPEPLIMHAAASATEAEKPIMYLNQIVRHYYKMGFKTVHDAIMDQQKHREETLKASQKEKTVSAVNYTQRSYAGEDLVATARFMATVFESQGRSEEEARKEAVSYALYKAVSDEEKNVIEQLKKEWNV